LTEKAGCLYSERLSIIPGAILFRILLGLVVFLSGACGLIYQSLWLRSLGLVFGSGSQAASLTLATFMGGLGLGAWLMRRAPVKSALRAYALIEAGMAASVLASLILLPALPSAYAWLSNLNLIPPLAWLGKLLLASLIVLPQASFAGATLPLLIAYKVQDPKQWHQGLARLYLLNTFGAACGVVAAGLLLPRLGLNRTVMAAAALNLSLAALAWRQRAEPSLETRGAVPGPSKIEGPNLFALLALASGAFGLGLELLWMRSLSLVIGASIYAFNLMLLSVLLGLVLGTWAYERWLKSAARDAGRWLRFLLLGLAVLLPLQVLLIGQLPAYYLTLKQFLPPSFGSNQVAGFALSFPCLLLVTAPLGMLFPLLSHVAGANSWTTRALSARLFAFNSTGAVLGALGCGFLLIPAVGLQAAYAWLAAIPLSLSLLLWGLQRGWQARQLLALPLGAVLFCAGLAPYFRPWDPGVMSSGMYLSSNDLAKRGGASSWLKNLKLFFYMPFDLPVEISKISRLLYYKEGAEAVVAVRQSLQIPATTLVINGKPDASNQDQGTQKLLAHLPLLLHPNPKNALIIGWGSGCSTGTTGLYPLESITCVELVPDTLETAGFFLDLNRGVLNDPRLKMNLQDGRTFLLAAKGSWDTISSEPPNPWISGVANLFTSEFYAIVSRHLNPGGIFCQFFHYYSMSSDDLKLELRTFARAFPHSSLWLVPAEPGQNISGDLCLVGSVQPHDLDPARFAEALKSPAVAEDLRLMNLPTASIFLATRLLGEGEMLSYAGDGPLNTDDRPLLEFSVPHSLYRSKDSGLLENQRHFLSLSNAKKR
jgi:spermidine synthase